MSDTFLGEPEPCASCKRTDWVVSVIVDGRRLCGGCKRRLVSEPIRTPAVEPKAERPAPKKPADRQRRIQTNKAASGGEGEAA